MVVHLSFSGKFYGRENAAFSLVRALQDKTDAMMLLVLEDRITAADREDLARRLTGFGIRNEVMHTQKPFSTSTLDELAEKLEQLDASVVHCHCHKSALYCYLIRRMKKGKPLIVLTLHGLIMPFGPKSLMHHLLNYFAIATVDGVIGCSREIVSTLSKVPLLKSRTTAIPNGYENFSRSRHSREEARSALLPVTGALEGKIVIAFIGRLTAQKNPPLFLNVVKRAKSYCDDRKVGVHFIMAGDGELRGEVERSAQELALADSLSITGYFAQMPLLYAAMDILLVTSDWEGTPMCILEAMSCSVPAVAPRVGGIPDVVEDGVTGLLFPRRDEEGCFAQLKRLIDSAELRREMSRRAYAAYRSNCNYETWAARHLHYYDYLMQKAQRRAVASSALERRGDSH